MKYVSILFGLFFVLSTLFSGCKNGDNSPKVVTIKFLTAIQHTNYKEAKKYATKDSKKMLDALSSFQKMLPEESLEKFRKGKISVLDIKVHDSLATVYYNSDQDSTKKALDLKKINGKWKVAFTKETILPDFNQPVPYQDSIPQN